MAPDITPELVLEMMQMPLDEIEKKVAEKRALLESLNGVMAEKFKVLESLANKKAQFEVQINKNRRYHAKQNKIVSEGTEEFKEAQVS